MPTDKSAFGRSRKGEHIGEFIRTANIPGSDVVMRPAVFLIFGVNCCTMSHAQVGELVGIFLVAFVVVSQSDAHSGCGIFQQFQHGFHFGGIALIHGDTGDASPPFFIQVFYKILQERNP